MPRIFDNIDLPLLGALKDTTFETEHFPFPPVAVQRAVAATLDGVRQDANRLQSIYQRKLVALEALKKSLLHQAFSREL